MDFLKKFSLAALIYLSFSSCLLAQSYEAIKESFVKSYQYEALNNYSKAIDAVKSVYSDESYDANIRLGWLHYLAGKLPESAFYYNKAVSLMPCAIEAKFAYVLPLAALGNWEQVIEQYKEILKIDPQNTTANYRLGLIYFNRSDFSSAKDFFELIINLYPMDLDTLVMLGWTNLKMKRNDEAKTIFNKVLLLMPMNASAVEGLSLIK